MKRKRRRARRRVDRPAPRPLKIWEGSGWYVRNFRDPRWGPWARHRDRRINNTRVIGVARGMQHLACLIARYRGEEPPRAWLRFWPELPDDQVPPEVDRSTEGLWIKFHGANEWVRVDDCEYSWRLGTV